MHSENPLSPPKKDLPKKDLPKLDQKFIDELIQNTGVFDELAHITKKCALYGAYSEFDYYSRLYRNFSACRDAHDELIKTLSSLHNLEL